MDIILDPLIRITLVVIDLYIWVVIIAAVLSWLVSFNVVNTQNRLVYVIVDFLYRLTEPVLARFRRFVPSLGGIDISPIVLILALMFLRMFLENVYRRIV